MTKPIANRISIDACARCGDDHEGLAIYRFERPLAAGGVTYDHWALCPSNDDPILVRIEVVA